jgi:predicted DNA-binding transcriptional regulator YafY
MSARRTERLLNLVIALLATRRWLTKEQIRQAVPQYAENDSVEAFDRMFERDKEALRELGVPLETGTYSAWFDDELGYRIDPDAYALPEIAFTPGELAMLGLASRVWQQASLAGPASRALVKLKALGVDTDSASMVGIEPRVSTNEPSFDRLYAATRDRAPVAFTYRRGGRGEPVRREVEPWQISSWHGRWYLIGFDRDRQDSRVFRLSRITGDVERIGPAGSVEAPEDVDAHALLHAVVLPSADDRTARLRIEPHSGQVLRRRAGAPVHTDEVEVGFADVDELAEEVAALGARAEVLDPPDLREAVVVLLKGAAAAHPLSAEDSIDDATPSSVVGQ